MLPRLLLAFIVCTLATPLWADTVWLDNGDRISGDIVVLDGGKLALKTKYAGQVLIDWKDIDTISSDKPLSLRRNGIDSEHSERLAAAGAGLVRVEGERSRVLPMAEITRLVPPRPLLEDGLWEGNLDAKLDMERNDSKVDEWKLKGNTRIEHGRWRHLLAGELEHETKNGRRSRTTGRWNTTSTASSAGTGSGERGWTSARTSSSRSSASASSAAGRAIASGTTNWDAST